MGHNKSAKEEAKEVRAKLRSALWDLEVTRARIVAHAENVGVPPGELRDQVGRYILQPIVIASIEGYSALLNSLAAEQKDL